MFKTQNSKLDVLFITSTILLLIGMFGFLLVNETQPITGSIYIGMTISAASVLFSDVISWGFPKRQLLIFALVLPILNLIFFLGAYNSSEVISNFYYFGSSMLGVVIYAYVFLYVIKITK